jgi:hypothetical protein
MLSAAEELEIEITKKVTANTIANNMIMLLNIKFGPINKRLKTQINSIKDINKLDKLFKDAVHATNINTFSKQVTE